MLEVVPARLTAQPCIINLSHSLYVQQSILWKASFKKNIKYANLNEFRKKIDPGSSFILIESNYAPRYEVGNKDSSATNEETLFPSFGNLKVTKEWQRLRESHFLLS